jgi:heat shock protein HslJ
MKPITILLAFFSLIITGCKDLEEVNGNYDITTVGENDYSTHDITLSIEMGEENKISGKSACNQYFGNFTNFKKNQVEIGALAGTKMYCNDLAKIENDYLSHLSKVAFVNTTKTGLDLLDKAGNLIIVAVKKEKE